MNSGNTTKAMKYYVIAGEASGDLHASNLLKALHSKQTDAQFRCWGGDLMQEAGGTVVKHYRELAFMGFLEVLLNIWTIWKNMRFCKQDIMDYKPDALILVDYPGFNLRIAKWAKSKNIRVIYYISPQIWAWNESRVHQIKKNVDLMLCILPFEQDFYKKYDYNTVFVGHPLLDSIKNDGNTAFNTEKKLKNAKSKPIIALLPGSRKQEVINMLETMLSVAPKFSDYQFVIAGAPSLDASFYETLIAKYQTDLGENVSFVKNETYNLLRKADAALVTSGTATLEVALFGVPQIVCYRTSAVSFWLAKRLIRIKYIALVNLIMNKPLVVELIQNKLTTDNLTTELHRILQAENKQALQAGYTELRGLLGNAGAALRAADAIIGLK
jgi:lipid-A-disaccharide synthase